MKNLFRNRKRLPFFLPQRLCYLLCALILISPVDSLSARRRRERTSQQTLDTASATAVGSSLPNAVPAIAEPPAPPFLPVESWTGQRFTVLPVAPAYRQFGYELYPSPALDRETTPPNPAYQLKNHRYRYETLVGKTLRVDRVERRDTAWFVAMSEELSGQPVYGLTHKDALKGLALVSDLEAAHRRWVGKKVYARKRQINTVDTASGRMGSVKVAIDQPLLVTDVRWGTLPLPPQPLWLVVQTPEGNDGIIPVHVSWTNVMSDQRRLDTEPWSEFILERNPRETYQWDEEIWEYINAHQLIPGMTYDQTRLCWGDPLSRDTVIVEGVRYVRWIYKGENLLFRDSTLVKAVPR